MNLFHQLLLAINVAPLPGGGPHMRVSLTGTSDSTIDLRKTKLYTCYLLADLIFQRPLIVLFNWGRHFFVLGLAKQTQTKLVAFDNLVHAFIPDQHCVCLVNQVSRIAQITL